MSRRVKNPLKGTNEYLVTSAPNGKQLQVMFSYSAWLVLDLQHFECVMSASHCALTITL